MNSFQTALNVVLPICVMLFAGLLLRKANILTGDLVSGLNKLIFRLFLPVNLFRSCYQCDFTTDIDLRLILFCCIGILLFFLLSIPVIRRIEPDNTRRSVMLQGAFRGNLAMFGIPVLTLVYQGNHLGIVGTLMAFMIPELNILAVLAFEVFGIGKGNWGKVFWKILTNPLIIAVCLGLLCNLLRIPLPAFLDTSIQTMASAMSPLAFVALGASFSFVSMRGHMRQLSAILVGKLILLPLMTILLGIFVIGLRGPSLVSAVTLFASPVAVSSVPMSEEMGGDVALAAEAVVLSTLLGVLSVFVWIFVLAFLNMI